MNSLTTIRAGACAAWALSATKECARQARGLVRVTARELGLAEGLLDDAMTMVSELATNALRHSGAHVCRHGGVGVAGLPELWTYLATPRDLVVTVFDTGEGWSGADIPEMHEADPFAETGRGLQVVAAMAKEAGGRWGHNLSRARLGEDHVPGNAAWFALPLPQDVLLEPVKADLTPAVAISRLTELLRSRGLNHLYDPAGAASATLPVCAGLTVWCHDGVFSWDPPAGGVREHHPITSEIDVAERVIATHETLTRHLPRSQR